MTAAVVPFAALPYFLEYRDVLVTSYLYLYVYHYVNDSVIKVPRKF